MTVNSLSFLIFFSIMVLIYYLPAVRKYQWVVLLIASYLFYMSAGIKSVIYILAATVTTYFTARSAGKLCEEKRGFLQQENNQACDVKAYKEQNKKRRNRVVLCEVIINIGILVMVKYMNFFIDNLNLVADKISPLHLNNVSLIVPLGISYYTLQSIGYVIDVSKGKAAWEKNFFKTALFITYFPQITQGPIGRFKHLSKQLFASREFSYHNLSYGCQRLLWGFFKKTVIADRIKPLTDTIFLNYHEYSGFTILLGLMYFSIQVYADFSGYMDIIGGCSDILGIRVAENFKRPFFSKSLAEYWRRWHITLGEWFRDYLFYPLSLSKKATSFGRKGRKILPVRIAKLLPSVYALSIVWFATGFWHDASWRYILWGVCNGMIIISSTCFEDDYKRLKKVFHIKDESKAWQVFCMCRTFLLVSLLKVFSAAVSTVDSLQMIKKIITGLSPRLTYALCFPEMKKSHLVYILFGLCIFFVISYLQEKHEVRDLLSKKPFIVRWLLYSILLFSILSFGVLTTDMPGGFEYAQY